MTIFFKGLRDKVGQCAKEDIVRKILELRFDFLQDFLITSNKTSNTS